MGKPHHRHLCKGFTALAGIPESIREILSAFVVLALEWGLCYWLFKKKNLL